MPESEGSRARGQAEGQRQGDQTELWVRPEATLPGSPWWLEQVGNGPKASDRQSLLQRPAAQRSRALPAWSCSLYLSQA